MSFRWLPLVLASCGAPHLAFPEPDDRVDGVPELGPLVCGSESVQSLASCIETANIERDVRLVAKPRAPGSEQHRAVQSLCAKRFAALGFGVQLMHYGSGTNVIGLKPGFSKPDQLVVVAAHYDHLTECDGADDNASGVAVVLETARALAQATFDRSLIVACWDEAERGQLGSRAFVDRAKSRADKVIVALNFESVGYTSDLADSQQIPAHFEELFPDQALAMLDNQYRADFLTVVSEAHTSDIAAAIEAESRRAELPVQVLRLSEHQKHKIQDEMHVSDHVSFWKADIPALLVTDTGRYRNPRVHCESGADEADSLDYAFAGKVARAALAGAVVALELR